MPACDYCGTEDLAYALESDRGTLVRCIPCLAIEQGQQKFSLPFDVWLDRDDIEPPDQDKFPDAPDFDPFDPRENDYEMARGWFTVLARWRSDKPLLERDPDAIGTVHGDLREFLTNIMGSAAHYSPSEIVESDGDPAQASLGGGDGD